MTRGRSRRRWIEPSDANVWCVGGRWGLRRTRTDECWAVFRAEVLYTALLEDNASRVHPGARGTVSYRLEDRDVTASWVIRANAVWQRGRVFLLCPRCVRRCTRLYLPLEDSSLACLRCWGLTYSSRTLLNYKNSQWGRGQFAKLFGTSQRDWAFLSTGDNRRARREASRNRWAERRQLLRA